MAAPSIFGTPLRDRILVLLAVKGNSHLREIARTFGADVSLVQRSLKRLEADGLVVGIARGRTRVLELNRRWFAYDVLKTLLFDLASKAPELYAPSNAVRARPRRSGKSL